MDTSRLHVYVEILAISSDSWIDHNGDPIDRIAFSKIPKGSSPEPIYDVVKTFGELDQRLGDLPTSPIQQLSTLSISLHSIWSSANGDVSTPNWYTYLQDVNAAAGKSFELHGRPLKVWLSNSVVPGVLPNSSNARCRYDGTNLGYATPAEDASPIAQEAMLFWLGTVDEIQETAQSITLAVTEQQMHTDIGTPVTSLIDGKSTMLPMPFGDCTLAPSPTVLVGADLLACRAAFSDSPCISFDSLAIWSDELGQYITVDAPSATANSDITAAQFVASNAAGTLEKARSATAPWDPTTAEIASLYDPSASAQALYAIESETNADPEYVGLHTNLGPIHFSGLDVRNHATPQPSVSSRGWGETPKKAAIQGASYYSADTGGQKTVRATVRVYPTEICEVGAAVASVPADREMLGASGDPWLFIKNSKAGAPSTADGSLAYLKTQITHEITTMTLPHARWIIKFPSLGLDGAQLVSVFVRSSYKASATRCSYTDPADGVQKFCLTFTIGEKVQQIYMGSSYFAHSNDYNPAEMDGIPRAHGGYGFNPAYDGVELADCQQLTYDLLMPCGAPESENDKYPYFILYGVYLEITVDIPISKAKFFFRGKGRSLATAPAILSNLLPVSAPGYEVDTTASRADIALTGTLSGASIPLRDSLREIAMASGNAVLFSPTTQKFVVRSLSAADLATSIAFTPDTICSESNMPALAFATPQRRYVHTSLTLRYGWHAGKNDYQYNLVANASGLTINGAPIAAPSSAWAQCLAQLGINSQTNTNALTIETKWVHTDAAARSLALHILQWASYPRKRAQLRSFLPSLLGLSLASCATISSIGLSSRLSAIPWLISAITTDLDNLTAQVELQEVWRPSGEEGVLAYLDQAEVSMLCIDGSDGKGNAFQLDAISGNAYPLFGLEWSSSDPAIATVDTQGIVRGVSPGDATISCALGGTVCTCLFTVYETMPSVSERYSLKGGSGGNSSSASDTALVTFKTSQICGRALDYFRCCESGFVHETRGAAGAPTTLTGAVGWYAASSMSLRTGGHRTVGNGASASATAYSWGPLRADLSFVTCDFGKSSEGYRYNGATYTASAGQSYTGWTNLHPHLAVKSYSKKHVLFSSASTPRTESDLGNPALCDMMYVPQNYIRHTNRSTWSNYTTIPNIGTLGNVFDLNANNVPAAWFGV